MKLPIQNHKARLLDFLSMDDPFWDKDFFSDWIPKLDMTESKNHYTVRINVPNVNPDDISIEVDEDTLTIEGKTESQKEEEGETWYRKECESGSFSRTLSLPKNADTKHISAKTKNGRIEIKLPKTKASHKKKVPLQ